jgi:predicted transcriptional regulator
MAKLTDTDKVDIVRLVEKGKAISALALDFHVSEQTIRNVVKKAQKGLKKANAAAWAKIKAGAALTPRIAADLAAATTGITAPCAPAAGVKVDGCIKSLPDSFSVKLGAGPLAERINTKLARSAYRKAAQDLSQAMLRDELTEALAEFFPEKPL